MRTSTARLSGAALLAAGVLGAAVPVAHPAHGPAYYGDPMTAPVHLLLFVAVLLVSLGLPGLVLAQPERSRPWAAAGAAMLFVGEWLLDGTHGLVDGAVLPALVQHQAGGAHGAQTDAQLAQVLAAGPLGTLVDVGVPVLILGCLMLGVTLARAAVVPRWAAVLLGVCWVLAPVSFVVPALRGLGVAMPYVAFAALGGSLLVARAARASARRAGLVPRVAHAAAAE